MVNVPSVYNVASKLLAKVRTPAACSKGESVITTWQFPNSKIHAGQIQATKILPNGNKQARITTVYGGGGIATDTRVYSPSGELLKSYHGLRNAKGNTVQYANTPEEVLGLIRKERRLNPSVKYSYQV